MASALTNFSPPGTMDSYSWPENRPQDRPKSMCGQRICRAPDVHAANLRPAAPLSSRPPWRSRPAGAKKGPRAKPNRARLRFAGVAAICERECAESRAGGGRGERKRHGNRRGRAGCGGERARPRAAHAGGRRGAAPRLPGEPDAVHSRRQGDARVVSRARPRLRHAATGADGRPARSRLSRDLADRAQAGCQLRHRQDRHLRRPLAHPTIPTWLSPALRRCSMARSCRPGAAIPTSPTCTRPTTRCPPRPRRASTGSTPSTPISQGATARRWWSGPRRRRR